MEASASGFRLAYLCAAASIIVTGGCAHKAVDTAAPAPDSLRVPGNVAVSHVLHGAGVQIYECTANHDGEPRYTWTLQTPAADLTEASGKEVGKHYAGPTWEATDGSMVVGEVMARDPGPTPNAIPWLLLRAKATTGKPKSYFGRTAFIQRLHTVGGQPPPGGCDAGAAGKRVRVAYSADYVFFVAHR